MQDDHDLDRPSKNCSVGVKEGKKKCVFIYVFLFCIDRTTYNVLSHEFRNLFHSLDKILSAFHVNPTVDPKCQMSLP